MVFNPTLSDGPIRDRPRLTRASTHLLWPAIGELVLVTTLLDIDASARAPLLNLFTRSLLAVALAVAFNVAMLAVLVSLAPAFFDAISPTVASRLERAAAVGSTAILLLATSLFVFVGLIGDY